MQALDDAYLDDAVYTMFQDIFALSRIKRTDQDIRKFRAKLKFVLACAGRHLSAKLPAACVPAQLIAAAILSEHRPGLNQAMRAT